NGLVVYSNANCSNTYYSSPGDARTLKVTVVQGGAQSVVTTGYRLVSAPSALVADTLNGKTARAFLQVSGNANQTNMGILTAGESSDASSLHNHDAHNDGRYLRINNNSQSQSLGSATTWTQGSFGIGTGSPALPLEIRGQTAGMRLGAEGTNASSK